MAQQIQIAIIGAGVMGLSCAYEFLHRGHSVTLYDPEGFPAHGASFMAGGMLAPYAEIEHMSADWIEAGLQGVVHWKKFSATHDISFAAQGSLLIAHPGDHYILERFAAYLPPKAKEYKETSLIEPSIADKFSKGLFLPAEAHLDPAQAMNALCRDIKARGGHMIAELQTPEALSAQYDYIIDCRGLGSADPELRGVKGEILLARNTEFSLSRPVRLMHPRYPLYIVPRAEHIFMIGATQIEGEDTGFVSLRSAMELMSALYALHPSFGEAQILEMRSGLRPSYPDNLPRIRQNGKIISANGLFRHGWLLSPVMAQSVADLVETRENPYISLFNGDKCETHHQRAGANVSGSP